MNAPPIPPLPEFAVFHWDAELDQWQVYGYRSTAEEAEELRRRASGKGFQHATVGRISCLTGDSPS